MTQSKKNNGFTIIEVLIVMAIAGMIFLLMFKAIPAFQRAGRNNERKQDVAKLLESVSRYALNNGGNFPTNDHTAVDSTPSNMGYIFRSSRLAFYVPATDVTFSASDGVTVADEPLFTDISKVKIVNYQKCDPSGVVGSISVAADYRDIVALFAIETASGSASQCQQL